MRGPEMFQSIYDMFIFPWWKLAETDDLTWILKDRNTFISKGKEVSGRLEVKLKQRRKVISDQFFNEIALNTDMEMHILKLWKLQEIRTKFILTRDRALETQYLILLKQIEGSKKTAKLSFKAHYDEKAQLEQHRGGTYIDPMTTPIMDYHSYIDRYIIEMEARARSKAA